MRLLRPRLVMTGTMEVGVLGLYRHRFFELDPCFRRDDGCELRWNDEKRKPGYEALVMLLGEDCCAVCSVLLGKVNVNKNLLFNMVDNLLVLTGKTGNYRLLQVVG